MTKNFSRRGFIRTVSFISAVIAALGIWGTVSSYRAMKLERNAEYTMQRALGELTACVEDIESVLNKEYYAYSPAMMEKLSSRLMREAAQAKSCLGILPASDILLENTYRFLSQVGAFSSSLSRKAAAGGHIGEEEYASLQSLSKCAAELSSRLESMCTYLGDGSLSFDITQRALGEEDGEGMYFSAAISDAEQAIVDYPTLIYDGPFSDHIMKRTPRMTAEKGEISENEAAKIAASFSGINNLERNGDEGGTMPSFGFKSGDTVISVTKQGGYPAYMLAPAYAGAAKLSPDEAIVKAADFLARHGMNSMRESYYSVSDGVCTVNFAYEQNGIICYPDLVKISVTLDAGKVIGFDARGYLMNHFTRTDTKPALSEEEAAKKISPSLVKKSAKLCIIPTDSEGEVLCYEFLCRGKKDEDVLIYINAATGAEENILFLTYGDNGIFAK